MQAISWVLANKHEENCLEMEKQKIDCLKFSLNLKRYL